MRLGDGDSWSKEFWWDRESNCPARSWHCCWEHWGKKMPNSALLMLVAYHTTINLFNLYSILWYSKILWYMNRLLYRLNRYSKFIYRSIYVYCDPMPGRPKAGIMLKNLALSLGDGAPWHLNGMEQKLYSSKKNKLRTFQTLVGQVVPLAPCQLPNPRLQHHAWRDLPPVQSLKLWRMVLIRFQQLSKKLEPWLKTIWRMRNVIFMPCFGNMDWPYP